MNRFPEVVPDEPFSEGKDDTDVKPPHDAFSVLFHLSHAASLQNAPACLAIGRVHAGLGTHVSELVKNPLVPLDFEAAKELLRRAMDAAGPETETSAMSILAGPIAPRVAGGCLLFQILQDERHAGMYHTIDEDDDEPTDGSPTKKNGNNASSSLTEIIGVAEETLRLFELLEKQQAEAERVQESLARTGYVAGTGNELQAGDRVEGDYFMEGSYYPGTVLEVSTTETAEGEPQTMVTVQYDDDGSSETLPRDHVRLLIPPTATQTSMGGPLSDEDAFGGPSEESDDTIPLNAFELLAELAELKVEAGDNEAASAYYQQAADGAIKDNKMKKATEWSLKAAELQA